MKLIISLFIILFSFQGFEAFGQNSFTQEDRERMVRLETKMEEMQKQMDLRFEAVDRRFEAVDRRFEDINNRFEDVNNRFGDINSRLDQQFNLILGILAAFVTMFVTTISFAIWDRKQAMKPVLVQTEKLSKDVQTLNKLLEALQELGKKDTKLREVLKQFNLL